MRKFNWTNTIRGVAVIVAGLLLTPCCFGLSGDATAGLVNGVYVVTVPSGKEANIQGADATAANEANAPIAKRGGGTLYSGSGFGNFAGELRIEEGSLWVNHNNSLGTTAGGTVVSNGAMLAFRNTENNLSYPGEAIAFAGKIQNSSQRPMLDAFPGAITVIGDNATFDGYPIGLSGTLALDGHTLTVGMNNSSYLLLRDVEVTSGGTILRTKGQFKLEGATRLSAREAYNFPEVTVENGGSLVNDIFGYGGNVAALTKTGDNVFTFVSSLAVTGETYVAQGTLRLGGAAPGTAGLRAAVTNFASQAAWEAFRDAASSDWAAVAANLLAVAEAQGFARTALSPDEAYRQWNTSTEAYKMGVYSGFVWNQDATNKVCTFAASIADTEVLWINGKRIFVAIASQKDRNNETHFVSVGEAVLRPGPNEFRFLLGHKSSGTKTGTRNDLRPQGGINWAHSNGFMYREGSYVAQSYGGYDSVTNYLDFSKLEDSGDGSLLTLTKQPPAALAPVNATYVPRFDALRFASGTTLDLGGLADFPQNGLSGCPCVTNGSMVLSGAWSVAKADIDERPMEIAAGARVTFAGATLEVPSTALPKTGAVVLHAAPGAAVEGLPLLSVTGAKSGKWEIVREEHIDGSADFAVRRVPVGLYLIFK